MRDHRTHPPETPCAEAPLSNGCPDRRPSPLDADIQPVETAFQRLLGRLPNAAERARIHAVRDTLRLRENDALWALFVALDHYVRLYEQFPPMIRAAAGEVLVEFKTATDALLQTAAVDLHIAARDLKGPLMAAAQDAVREAREEFVSAARRMADRAARRARLERFWPWLLGGVASIALALALAIGIALGYGRQQGYAAGYAEGYTLGLQQAQAPASSRPPYPPPARGR